MTYPNPDIEIVIDFLSDFPEQFSTRKKKNRPDPLTSAGKAAIRQIMIEAKTKRVGRVEPKTIPDPAVSVILDELYLFPIEDLERIKIEHQYSMLAEDAVGELLEDYIEYASNQIDAGWVRAHGDVIRSVDFVKRDISGWRLIQIKNRDNSENSSSQSVRDGTKIEKWFRTFSRTGRTNWHSFPDNDLGSHLSEENFIKHIRQYFSGNC